jgi:hypothetical protein
MYHKTFLPNFNVPSGFFCITLTSHIRRSRRLHECEHIKPTHYMCKLIIIIQFSSTLMDTVSSARINETLLYHAYFPWQSPTRDLNQVWDFPRRCPVTPALLCSIGATEQHRRKNWILIHIKIRTEDIFICCTWMTSGCGTRKNGSSLIITVRIFSDDIG